jgi:2'-5' RNA ligase
VTSKPLGTVEWSDLAHTLQLEECSWFVLHFDLKPQAVTRYRGRACMQSVFEFYRDLPARPKRPERLFFALCPDPETALCVEQFGRRFLDQKHWKGTPLKTKRLHVSLHHVGDYRRLQTQVLYAAKRAAAAVSMRPFAVTLRFIKSVEPINGRPRQPLVLLAEGDALLELHNILSVAMKKNGLRAAEHFTPPPHMTLSYGRGMIPEQAIEPICFAVNEFVLIHSELWLTRYHVLGRWPLQSPSFPMRQCVMMSQTDRMGMSP